MQAGAAVTLKVVPVLLQVYVVGPVLWNPAIHDTSQLPPASRVAPQDPADSGKLIVGSVQGGISTVCMGSAEC